MFDRLFLSHPRSVGEGYGAHMRVAGRVGLLLIGGGIAALIHAVFPRFHQTTGSMLIRNLAAELEGRSPPVEQGDETGLGASEQRDAVEGGAELLRRPGDPEPARDRSAREPQS